MSVDHDSTDAFGEESDQDSPVLKEARKRERALQKQVADMQAKLDEVEKREATAREEAAEKIVNDLGIPGLKDDVLGWVEGDVTADAVADILKAKGIPVNGLPAVAPEQVPAEQPTPASTVGQRIADAAAGTDVADIDERLANAQTTEEITAIMAEIGAIRSHS